MQKHLLYPQFHPQISDVSEVRWEGIINTEGHNLGHELPQESNNLREWEEIGNVEESKS